jgi:spore germination protein GerM
VASPAASVTGAPTTSPTTAAPPASVYVAPTVAGIYFTSGGKLVPESAQVDGAAPVKPALELLLAGPKSPDHFSQIPKGVQLEDVSVSGNVATVSFDASFFGAGGTGVQLRLAQVVYTATQFPPVTMVRFLRQGQPVDVVGEGFPLNQPLGREQFAQLAG